MHVYTYTGLNKKESKLTVSSGVLRGIENRNLSFSLLNTTIFLVNKIRHYSTIFAIYKKQ